MAGLIHIVEVVPLDNPCPITDPVKLQITFEASEDIHDEVDWEMLVAWDGNEANDMVLECVTVGPLIQGKHQFVFECDAPDYSKVNAEDLLDVSVLFLRCSYKEQLFTKVAFFMDHAYTDPELLENPPPKPLLEKLQRTIHTNDVRVTQVPIKWREADSLMPPPQPEDGECDDDEELVFTLRRPYISDDGPEVSPVSNGLLDSQQLVEEMNVEITKDDSDANSASSTDQPAVNDTSNNSATSA